MWLHYFLIIYIIIIGILFGQKDYKINKKICLIFIFGLFFFLSALRSRYVGNDTIQYIKLFERIQSRGEIASYVSRYEIGYLYLNKLLSLFFNNSQIIIVVTSCIIIIGFSIFIYKYSKNIWLSCYLFFTIGYFGSSMNTIRSYIAIIIILFSYDFLRENKLLKFIILVVLASFFHKTAIIFIIALPISKLKFSYKLMGIILGSALSAYLFFPIILNIFMNIFPIYKYYVGSIYLNGETRLASIMNFLVVLSILFFCIYLKFRNNKNNKDINNKDDEYMIILLLIGIALIFVSFRFNLLNRVGEYFNIFSIIYLPNVLKNIKNKNERIVFTIIVILMFFIYSTTIQIMRPEWNTIYPYSFFFNNN